MNKIDAFFKETNFDDRVKQAIEYDILFLSKDTKETLVGFGLYTSWSVDLIVSEEQVPVNFWINATLSEEGFYQLDEDEYFATGSWDGFDQTSSPKSMQIQEALYKEMWLFCEESGESDGIVYDEARMRVARQLLACEKSILEHFTISSNEAFILSVAEHDEYEGALNRMKEAQQEGDHIPTELAAFYKEIVKTGYAWSLKCQDDNCWSIVSADRDYDHTLDLWTSKEIVYTETYGNWTVEKLSIEDLLNIKTLIGLFGPWTKDEATTSFAWVGINIKANENLDERLEISKHRFVKGLMQYLSEN